MESLSSLAGLFTNYRGTVLVLSAAVAGLIDKQQILNAWDKVTVTWGKLKTFWHQSNRDAIWAEALLTSQVKGRKFGHEAAG